MALPPAQPAYILRGHSSQIHAVAFIRENARLVTGDVEGWVVLWNLSVKRPTAVWRAHEGAILGVSAWGEEKIITHGKDNKLIVWKLSTEGEASMSKVLPVDTPPEPRKQPWLLHVLEVNTMNFCSFAQCLHEPSSSSEEALLVAVPNILSSETVDIFHLPTSTRIHTILASPSFKGGMIMALSIYHSHSSTSHLTVIAAFESGHTSVTHLTNSTWQTLYIAKPHTQPILSLSLHPSLAHYYTSSADSLIARHTIPSTPELVKSVRGMETAVSKAEKVVDTKHAGQQSLRVRKDGKIFATAGWDGRVRVYSEKGMKELAVLKWHKEGCYAVGFADVEIEGEEVGGNGEVGDEGESREVARKTLREEREEKARRTHWIAVGSKDGKVSLWDVY